LFASSPDVLLEKKKKGITRVPVGDQPADIEEQIRDMILKYISPVKSGVSVVGWCHVV
jgi:hypothetical protein